MDTTQFEALLQKNSQKLRIQYKAYLRIITATLTESENDILKLEKAIQTRDYSVIRNKAHGLKGICGNLLFDGLHKIVKKIDKLAHEKGDIEDIEALFLCFKDKIVQIKEQVNALN